MGLARWLIVALLAVAGCGEGPDPTRVEAELAAGRRVEICDATLKVAEGQVIVEGAMNPEPMALMVVALVPFCVLLVLLVLRKVRPLLTLIVMVVLLLSAVGLSAFVGNERFVFERDERQLKQVEGWFLNLYETERAIPYFSGMELYANEEETDETLWLRIWVRTSPSQSVRIVECRGTASTTPGLRQTLPSLARVLESQAGLR